MFEDEVNFWDFFDEEFYRLNFIMVNELEEIVEWRMVFFIRLLLFMFGVRSLRLGVIIVILVSSLVVFEFLVSFDFEEVYLLIDILMKMVILLLLLYLLNWMYCD